MSYSPGLNGGRINVTIGGNTAGASTLVSTGTLTLAGGNNVTLSQNGNAVTISAFTQTVQTQNRFNLTLTGNTAGAMAQVSSGTLTLAGGNNITLSQAGNAITISGGAGGGAFTAGMSTGGNTSGTTGTVTNQMIFAGGNNITLSQSTGVGGNTISISAPNIATASAPFAQQLAGNSTSGGAGYSTVTSGTMQWAGGNNITLSQDGQSVTISGAAGGGGGGTLSRYEYPEGFFTSINSAAQGSLSLNHFYMPFNLTGTAMKIGGSLSAATNTSATTASANVSLWMGIYSLNGSTLSLASSGSANNGFVWSQSASSTGNTSINSMRQMTVPMNINMTPGQYWVGAIISSATTYTSFGYTIYGNNLLASGATNAVLTPIGSNTTDNRDAMLFQGIYTAATSAGPASIVGTQINNTSASNPQRANFYWAGYNATY